MRAPFAQHAADDGRRGHVVVRRVLGEGREHLLVTLAAFGDDRLEEIPAALSERKLTIRDVLYILGWHEAHHQGQAHITFNLYKAGHA